MQVTQEPLDPCQVALTIEVETDKVVHAVDKAYREYAKYVSVPGFRKGKAPINFVRQRIPESDVKQRTAELLVEPAYAEALKETDIQPFAPPKLELVQLELSETPFIFKAVVPLKPVVELGDYTGIDVVKKNYELTDSDVDTQLEKFRERAAEYPKVERPIEDKDLVVADVAVKLEDQDAFTEPRPTMIEIGGDNIPGFDDQVLGLSIGDEKTFSLTYPDTYPQEEIAGKSAEFQVTIKEVHTKNLPDLDDALVESITNGRVTSLETFKTDLRADMARSLQTSSTNELETSLVEKIVENANVKFPPMLVEAEVEDDVRELMSRLEREKVQLDDYLARIGKSREETLAEIQVAAEKRIRIGLVLGEIAQKESLNIVDADVDEELRVEAEQQRTSPAALRAFLESSEGLDGIRNRAQTKKVLDFLTNSAIIKEEVVTSSQADQSQPADETDADADTEPKKTAKRGTKTKASDDQ